MPANLWASRQKIFRVDYSNEWRYEYGDPDPPDRSVELQKLLPSGMTPASFKFLILGDTGEAGNCQYGLLPLIKGLKPNFMLINGDVAYPSGRIGTTHDDDDFLAGFFEPYRNMNLPIWATIGNHEYYSPGNGREFYETFCTRKFDFRWACYGLDHTVLQPGTYWELDDLNGPSKLVILGLDTGKSANLDGHNDWWQLWKRSVEPDLKQDAWLRSRLDRAEKVAGSRVMILFHIPALVREKKAQEYLNMLHRAIAGYDCVKVIVAAHEHNFQLYSPDTFRNYLQTEELSGALVSNSSKPAYIVAGSSGASLEDTMFFQKGKYKSDTVYPSTEDWKKQANPIEKTMRWLGMNKTMVSDIESRVNNQDIGFGYNNVPMYSTCLQVEIGSDSQGISATLTPAFLRDTQDLFSDRPDKTMIDIMSDVPAQNLIDACLQRQLTIRF